MDLFGFLGFAFGLDALIAKNSLLQRHLEYSFNSPDKNRLTIASRRPAAAG